MSSCIILSASLKLTTLRNAVIISSSTADVFNGLRNSNACTAVNNSIANTFSTLSTTLLHLVAALAPILTWSSWLLLLGMVSTDDGVQSCLFSLTIPAAVYWGIIKPEFSPGLETKNAGKPLCPLISWYVLLSEMLASSLIAIAKKSKVMANGCP